MAEPTSSRSASLIQIGGLLDYTFLGVPADYKGSAANMVAERERQFNLFLKHLKIAYDDGLKPYGVCVFPSDVARVKDFMDENKIKDVALVSVIDFPGGYNSVDFKKREIDQAHKDGATIFDIVRNSSLYDESPQKAVAEVNQIANHVHSINESYLLRYILETPTLSTMQKYNLVQRLENDVEQRIIRKTATTQAGGGATIEDAQIFRGSEKHGAKFSGGIHLGTNPEKKGAVVYDLLDEYLLGPDQPFKSELLDPAEVTIGASGLLGELYVELKKPR